MAPQVISLRRLPFGLRPFLKGHNGGGSRTRTHTHRGLVMPPSGRGAVAVESTNLRGATGLKMALPPGFEPGTIRLTGECSAD